MNIVDIIAFVSIIIAVVLGSKKGFVKSVFSLCSLLLSIVLALTLYPIVTDFLKDSVVDDYVRLNVYKVLGEENDATITPEESTEKLNLPGSFQNAFTAAVDDATDTIKESLADTVSNLAMSILGIIIVFVIVKLLLWILLHLFDAVAKFPVIRTANKFLGGVAGAIYGLLFIYLILALFTFTTTIAAFNKPIELILDSTYVSGMYHQNILLNFLK